MTARTLNRRFQTSVNLKPIEYIQAVRIEQAKRLLEHGNINLKSLPQAVGYDDYVSFNRLFKRICDLSPKEYQNKFYRN